LQLADYFSQSTRLRIEQRFHALRHNTDNHGYKIAQTLLKSEASYLSEGVIG